MSAFVHHGVRGGFISAFPFWLFGFGLTAKYIFIIQTIIGTCPDILEFIARVFFGSQIKADTHSGWINNLMKWNPAWSLHTEVEDKFFHSIPDNDWRKIGNEWVSWFVLDPIMIWVIFFK